MRRGVVVVFAMAVAIGVAACGGSPSGYTMDEDLRQALVEVSEAGEPTPLADLTDFEWDTVHVFGEAASAADVQEVVGAPVLEGEFFPEEGDLLVFTLDGEVQRALGARFGPIVTDGVGTGHSSAVELVPRDTGGLLELREP